MQQIEEKMIGAIHARANWRQGNTHVECHSTTIDVYLHNNLIARVDWETMCVYLSSAGWETRTTASRLNAIAREFGVRGVSQKGWLWFFDDGTPFESWVRQPIPGWDHDNMDSAA